MIQVFSFLADLRFARAHTKCEPENFWLPKKKEGERKRRACVCVCVCVCECECVRERERSETHNIEWQRKIYEAKRYLKLPEKGLI